MPDLNPGTGGYDYHYNAVKSGSKYGGDPSNPDSNGPDGVFDWWQRNGNIAVDAAGDLVCLVAPNSARCRPQFPPPGYSLPVTQNNMQMMYLMMALMGVLVVVLIFKN
ncbi:MAG: hypothetical protein AAFP08_08710 [Bacteroidota bacterium]